VDAAPSAYSKPSNFNPESVQDHTITQQLFRLRTIFALIALKNPLAPSGKYERRKMWNELTGFQQRPIGRLHQFQSQLILFLVSPALHALSEAAEMYMQLNITDNGCNSCRKGTLLRETQGTHRQISFVVRMVPACLYTDSSPQLLYSWSTSTMSAPIKCIRSVLLSVARVLF
jgi:hypothetical protein